MEKLEEIEDMFLCYNFQVVLHILFFHYDLANLTLAKILKIINPLIARPLSENVNFIWCFVMHVLGQGIFSALTTYLIES